MIDCFSTRIFRHGGYRTEMIRRSFKDVVIGLVVGYIFGVKAFNLKPAVLSVMVSEMEKLMMEKLVLQFCLTIHTFGAN